MSKVSEEEYEQALSAWASSDNKPLLKVVGSGARCTKYFYSASIGQQPLYVAAYGAEFGTWLRTFLLDVEFFKDYVSPELLQQYNKEK